MNLQEYKDKERELYKRFSKIVSDITHIAIESSGYHYHLQTIQFRAKTVESLTKKLSDRKILETENVENEIKDLAGCRIIFYYNDDVNSFTKSGIITENFNVDWDKSKIHYDNNPESVNDYYTGIHYLVELNEQRTKLPEYKKFSGMKCEIQVHTVLDNAWSETAHDITYKKTNAVGFGSNMQKSIESRLLKIMEGYLRPAGYEFQKVKYDYQRLAEGKELIDRDVVQEIQSSEDANQLFDIVERFKEYALPQYDDISKEIDLILTIVKTAINKSRTMQEIAIKTPLGTIPGKTSLKILDISLDILNFVRYVDFEAVFELLIMLYSQSTTKDEKDKIIEIVKHVSEYNLDVLKKVGTHVQSKLISVICKWDDDTLIVFKDLVFTVCEAVINCTAEGTSSSYKTLTINRANLIGNNELERIHKEALKILKHMYSSANSEEEKRKIIGVFSKACRPPYQGTYDDRLHEIILRNTTSIVEFYIVIIPGEQYDILESIEEDVLYLYRSAKQISDREGVEPRRKQNELLLKSILRFREKLNSNEKFVIYKTLVGFESVFPFDWDDDHKDYTRTEKYRNEKIVEFAMSITEDNEKFWVEIILLCARTKSNDMATFPTFGKFLSKLAEINPTFIMDLIAKHETEISIFLTAIMDGLLKGEGKKKALKILSNWITTGKNLYYCARIFEYNSDLDEVLLKKLFTKAKKQKDINTLIGITGAIAQNYDEDRIHLVKDIFLPAIKELTKYAETGWINALWYREKSKPIISEISEPGTDIILENLRSANSIDFHAEEILSPIAKKSPKKVIKFFIERLKREEASESYGRYDAVPYEFHSLSDPLSTIPDEAVAMVAEQFDGDYGHFIYRGANLLKNIFPDFPETFRISLSKLVQSHEENNILIVLAILRNYKGEPFLHGICKEIILALPEGSKLVDEVEIILESTGVVSGEFGFAVAYESKKKEVEGWLTADEDKIRKFAEGYTAMLDRQIADEKRRVEQEIELRKHQYGDNERGGNDT